MTDRPDVSFEHVNGRYQFVYKPDEPLGTYAEKKKPSVIADFKKLFDTLPITKLKIGESIRIFASPDMIEQLKKQIPKNNYLNLNATNSLDKLNGYRIEKHPKLFEITGQHLQYALFNYNEFVRFLTNEEFKEY